MTTMTKAELLSKERLDAVQSQKAKAIFTYARAYDTYSIPHDWPVPTALPVLLTDTALQVGSAGEVTGFPAFLRTCPLTPRHGVLESVRVDTNEELHAEFTRLRDIMLKEDPEGCLMLMPFIAADNSAVVALSHDEFTGYAVFGPGHDGVTAGHGLQIGLPLRKEGHSDNVSMKALNYSPESHELEFVFGFHGECLSKRGLIDTSASDNMFLTQIRGAPEHTEVFPPPEGVDTIGMVAQGEVVVSDSIVMSGLEEVAWLEENITKEKCPDGFVVVEPNGSRLSHIYAHCRGVGVPYIITESVNNGDRWVEASPGWVVLDNDGTFDPQPYSPASFKDDFIRGLEAGNLYWGQQHGWFSTFFHQWVSLPYSKPQDTAFLAGVFCAWLSKSIMALGLGEMRHARTLKQNANAPLFAAMHACVGDDVWQKIDVNFLGVDRKHYYAAIGHLAPDYMDMGRMMTYLATHFKSGWKSAFGGVKWGESMVKGADLAIAIARFLNAPTDDHLDDIIQKANVAENCVHNNGFLFNKWLSKRALDAGTSGFNLRDDARAMSAVYAMAAQMLEPDDDMVPAEPPQHDWEDILGFVLKKKPSYWRREPLALSITAPEALVAAAKSMPAGYRHGDIGSHNSPSNKNFIMCGIETCSTCAMFKVWATQAVKSEPELQYVENIFSADTASIMLTPPKLDVWLTGTLKQTSASIKQQVALIKAKQFDPSAEEFKAIYDALNPMDPDYSEMSLVMNKWLAKKGDGLKEFMEQLTGKKEDKEGQE